MRRPSAALAALGLVLAAGACGQAQGHTAAGGDTLTVLSSANPDSIDPAVSYTQMGWQLLLYTNDGLLAFARRPPGTGVRLVADLAAAVPRPSDGGRTYVFRLRRDFRFSTGQAVRPADVRASLERLLSVGSPGAWTLADVAGAAGCRPGHRCDLSRGVVPDGRAMTVTFHLTRPDPEFLRDLALPFADVLSATAPRHEAGTSPLPATGPYRIQSYQPGRQIVLVRNPHYRSWSADAQPPGVPARIVWHLGGRSEDEVTEVERGRADYVLDPVPADRLSGIQSSGANVHVAAQPALYYLFLNTRTPPFDDRRVRQALNLALDRSAVGRLFGGPTLARPACELIPPGLPGHVSFCPWSSGGGRWRRPEFARASALVRASGTTGQAVAVWAPDSEPGRPIATYVVSLLKRLGYRASLRALATGVYFSTAANSARRAQLGFWNWYPDYPDAADFFRPFSCAGFVAASAANVNPSGYCNPRLDRLVRHAATLAQSRPARADRLYARADRLVTEDAPLVPLFTPRTITLLGPHTSGYRFSAQAGGPLLDLLHPAR